MDLLRAALHRAEWRAERNAVRALAAAGKGAGLDLILRGLSQDDMVLRAEALEALEASTHSRSGRMISQLIEDTGKTPEGADPAALVEAIAADHDPWLQALAAGAGLELADRARAAVLARVERDAHPLVVELIEPAARTGGTTMPETLDTLSSLQRMVALRRAHLFKTLEMDDLKTVADLADERLYSAGDVIYADGDEGDEMLVIVEGCAVVSRTTDGERREVRRYDAGEHVGELALLRGRPRSADVHADGDLRGLAITGASLLGLMDERPAIARAMLASLAERLGTTA